MSAEATPKIQKRLGRFELVHELGHGGMATVYLARTKGPAGFQKWVAIKQVHPHLAKDERFVNMFLDEARIAAAVQHPNVAQVFELGDEDGAYFLAMEYLHGEHLGAVSIAAFKQDEKMDYALAAKIVADAARGLHHAHESVDSEGRKIDLVHRDVSPQNIFVTYDGQIKVTDFGIAKAQGRITHTNTGNIKGKAAYMAPEQAMGHDIDRTTDIFALGVVLWEITVGKRLFKAQSQAQTLMRVMKGDPTLPSELRNDYPPALEDIVMRALSFEPGDRQQTASELADSLENFVSAQERLPTAGTLEASMTRWFAAKYAARTALMVNEDVTSIEVRKSTRVPLSKSSLSIDVTQSERIEPSSSVNDVDPRSRSLVVSKVMPKETSAYSNWRRLRWMVIGIVLSALFALLVWKVSSSTKPAAANGEPEKASAKEDAIGANVLSPTQRVRIESNPEGAQVFLKNKQLGTTPLELDDLSAGNHTLTLTLPGHDALTKTFKLGPGATLQLSYEMRALERSAQSTMRTRKRVRPPKETGTGKLTLISLPYVTLRINGGPKQTTPVTLQAKAGKVRVSYQVRGTGPIRQKTLLLGDGESKKIRLNTQ